MRESSSSSPRECCLKLSRIPWPTTFRVSQLSQTFFTDIEKQSGISCTGPRPQIRSEFGHHQPLDKPQTASSPKLKHPGPHCTAALSRRTNALGGCGRFGETPCREKKHRSELNLDFFLWQYLLPEFGRANKLFLRWQARIRKFDEVLNTFRTDLAFRATPRPPESPGGFLSLTT